MNPAVSFVVPMYNAAATIGPLVRDIEQLQIDGGHEIVLVNDGGVDETLAVCRELVRTARVPITVIDHARNFGEHNAVLTGWRHARGAHIINLDDDGQNPPREAVRLWLIAWLNFSLLPLRLATFAGLATAGLGLVAFVVVLWLWFVNRGPAYGFGWLMSAFLVFSGTQLVMLGLIGEYLGRMFLTVNQRPQAVVREVLYSGPRATDEHEPRTNTDEH